MHGVSAVASRSRTCGATVALVAVLVLVALCTFGTAVGRARSDLLFYGCAFAQAGLALAAAALAARSPARMALPSIIAVAVAAGAALLALSLWTRRRGEASLPASLGGTALLVVVFLLLLTPVFPWYFLLALPFTALLGLWSPFALSTGSFLVYGFNADAPAFLLRWSFLMALVLLAAARDAWCWRGMDGVPDA
ncbi:hypothetical protein [Lichenibacterium dinghuense]|uniref:hypothetical protein n=1 Tax=Lichenibacterium dinghuense TaxID=2895977 RepID=UPI001F488295|nr:hypothetical protein [Lichenibacterium sp. 6Y81]